MTDLPVVAAFTVAAGAVMAFAAGAALRRLREPVEPGDKTPYRELASARFVLTCAAWAVGAQLVAGLSIAETWLPLWSVLATFGVFLAVVDARTTWLPRSVTCAGWASMAAAALLSLTLGAEASDLLRMLTGAAVAGALYLTVWAVTRGGFGFGDVRFAPLLGAATAAESWTLLLWGLTLGTVVGALHGTTRLLRRRAGSFPYAPSMLAGSYLAAAALRLLVLGQSP